MTAARSTRQLLLDVRPTQIPTLDNFVVGGNGELVSALARLAADTSAAPALYLWGNTGSGRSHLLSAAAALAHATLRHAAAVDGNFDPPVGSLVVVDDVEALSADAQIALFRCFNDIRIKRLRILLSGKTPPLALPCREDLRTRIGQALIYEVKPLSDGEKASALLYHAAQRGMKVDDNIIEYLLRHGRRDIPFLMAVLDALDQQSLEQQRPVTLPLLREILTPSPQRHRGTEKNQ